MKPLNMTERGTLSHDASILLAATTEDKRNQALQAIASALRSQQDFIIEANQKDLEMAKANKLDASASLMIVSERSARSRAENRKSVV